MLQEPVATPPYMDGFLQVPSQKGRKGDCLAHWRTLPESSQVWTLDSAPWSWNFVTQQLPSKNPLGACCSFGVVFIVHLRPLSCREIKQPSYTNRLAFLRQALVIPPPPNEMVTQRVRVTLFPASNPALLTESPEKEPRDNTTDFLW